MAQPYKNTPPKPEKLGAMTEECLKAAFAGESQANRKYLAFAKKADADGFEQIARLFRAAAEAEVVAYGEALDDAAFLRDVAEAQRALGFYQDGLRPAEPPSPFSLALVYDSA